MKAVQVFYILFIQELKMLWRNELGNPKWRLRRRYIIFGLVIISLLFALYRFFISYSVPDSRYFFILSFINLLYIWSSINLLNLLRDSANYHMHALTPLLGFYYTLVRFNAHLFYHTTLLIIIAFPFLLNMIFGDYLKLVGGLLSLYIIAFPIVSLSWLVVLMIIRWLGVEGTRKFIRSLMIVFGVMWLGLLPNVERISYLIIWCRDSAVIIPNLLMIILLVILFVFIAVWLMTVVMKKPTKPVKGARGGTKLLGKQGFMALLIKEYRLLFRLSKKMILYLLGNYIISFSVAWIMFRFIQPNEMYFYVSLTMFLFFLYPAGSSNILAAKEENFWRMLYISPTPIRNVLLVKTIAVYSLIAPIILLIGYTIFHFANVEVLLLIPTLCTGLLIAIISVWIGVVETIMRMTGRSFWELFKVSFLSFLGSLVIFTSTSIYFIEELNFISYILWISLAVLGYVISIRRGLRLCYTALENCNI